MIRSLQSWPLCMGAAPAGCAPYGAGRAKASRSPRGRHANKGSLTGVMNRRLQQLDAAFAVARHLSEPKAQQFWDRLSLELHGVGSARAPAYSDGALGQ